MIGEVKQSSRQGIRAITCMSMSMSMSRIELKQQQRPVEIVGDLLLYYRREGEKWKDCLIIKLLGIELLKPEWQIYGNVLGSLNSMKDSIWLWITNLLWGNGKLRRLLQPYPWNTIMKGSSFKLLRPRETE